MGRGRAALGGWLLQGSPLNELMSVKQPPAASSWRTNLASPSSTHEPAVSGVVRRRELG